MQKLIRVNLMVRVNLNILQKLIFASFFCYKYNTEPSTV